MDGHRGHGDDAEPSWYSGPARSYESGSPYDSGVHERPSGAFRLPEQRITEGAYEPPAPYLTPDPVLPAGGHARPPDATVRVPVRGPEYPTVRPPGATSAPDAPAPYAPAEPQSPAPAYAEPTGVVPTVPAGGGTRARAGVYRTGRPLSALLVAAVTGLLMIPTGILLVHATFIDDVSVQGVVPAVLLTLGLPLAGLGLYALAAGAPGGRDAWLRLPLAYLPIGLLLLATAALAVA